MCHTVCCRISCLNIDLKGLRNRTSETHVPNNNNKALAVPGLQPGPRLWCSSPQHQGRSAASSAQLCSCSGRWGSHCWRPGSRCLSGSSSELSCVNFLPTLRETQIKLNEKAKGAWPTKHTLLPLHLSISMFYGSSRLCAITELRITGKVETCSTLRCGKKMGRGQ